VHIEKTIVRMGSHPFERPKDGYHECDVRVSPRAELGRGFASNRYA
jgi:hypothetical protein